MIIVDGITEGLISHCFTPLSPFPGHSGFTAGTGARTVEADGFSTWTSKTGERIVVEFRAGDIRSQRVIIEAQ